jgi:hypothetical protein
MYTISALIRLPFEHMLLSKRSDLVVKLRRSHEKGTFVDGV